MRTGFLLLIFTLVPALSAAQSPLLYRIASNFEGINAGRERFNDLYEYTQVLEDPTGEWTYKDILLKTSEFRENTTRLETDLKKVYWVKLQLQAPKRDSFLFSVGKLYNDHNLVDLYYQSADSLVRQKSGYKRRPVEKVIRSSGSYFWITLPKDSPQTLYFRVDNIYRDCNCHNKNPISVFHIDRQSAKDDKGIYVLPNFESELFTSKRRKPRKVELARYFEFFPDPDCNLGLEEVRQNWDRLSYFRGFKARDLPLDTCHWVRLRLANPESVTQTRTFVYDWNRWKRIEYYLPNEEGHYQKFEAFPNANDQKAFSFSVGPGDTLTLYIRYPKRNASFTFNGEMIDIHPGDLSQYQGRTKYKYLIFGMLLFFLTYILLQLIVNRDKLLWYYFLALLGMTPYFLISLDHTAFFTYTQSLYMLPKIANEYTLILARLLASYGLIKFTQVALDLKYHLPLYNKLANSFLVIMLILATIDLILWTLDWTGQLNTPLCLYCIFNNIFGKSVGLLAGFLLFTAIRAYIKKTPLSGNFLIALIPVVGAIFWNSFLRLFLFPELEVFGPFVIGLFLSLLLFSILIGARTHRMQLEKIESEKQKIQLNNQLLQIEFKALRAQMNPHFIFNCLNSIKSLIHESANRQAIHYLTLFSKFLRNVLQHSEEKRITLDEELNISRLYLEMEKLRFEDSFNYKLIVAADVDTSFVQVPPMILQPFLENAIWHGLMHKNGERMLHLEVCREGDTVKCIVDDNGIGRQQAAILQAGTRSAHRSFGTRLILDRLQINKELFDSNFVIKIIDKMVNGQAAGTRVELSLST